MNIHFTFHKEFRDQEVNEMIFKTPSGGSVGKESACNVGDPGLTPGWEDFLVKEMATHTNTLAWRSTWTEEPARQAIVMGWQRVRNDCVTFTFLFTHIMFFFFT